MSQKHSAQNSRKGVNSWISNLISVKAMELKWWKWHLDEYSYMISSCLVDNMKSLNLTRYLWKFNLYETYFKLYIMIITDWPILVSFVPRGYVCLLFCLIYSLNRMIPDWPFSCFSYTDLWIQQFHKCLTVCLWSVLIS